VQRVPGFPRQSWRADGLIAKVPPIIPALSNISDVLSCPTSSPEAKKSEAKPVRSSVDDTWTTPKAYQVISDPIDFVETDAHEGVECKILAAYEPPPSLAAQQMSKVPSFPRPSSRADGHLARADGHLAKVPPIIPAPVIPVPSVCGVYRRSM
jgi:hypothetical protein